MIQSLPSGSRQSVSNHLTTDTKVAAAAAAEDKTLRRERFNISVLLENRRSDVGRSALPAHTTAPEGALFPAAKILLKRSGKADAVRRSTGRVEGRGISAVFLESPPLTALDTPSRRTANHGALSPPIFPR